MKNFHNTQISILKIMILVNDGKEKSKKLPE